MEWRTSALCVGVEALEEMSDGGDGAPGRWPPARRRRLRWRWREVAVVAVAVVIMMTPSS